MRRHLLLMAVVASTTHFGGQESARVQETAAAIQQLRPLCAQEEATDRAEAQLLRTPASAAVTRALTSDAAFWSLLTDPATPYLDRMMAAQNGAAATSLERLPMLWKAAAELEAVPVGVYPSPCYFLRSAQYGPRDWLIRRERSFGATVSTLQSRLVAGRTVALPLEAVDYPVTPDARAGAPWLWQMRRAFNVLMPGVRKYFAAPARYPAMAEAAWNWKPADSFESHERLEALRTGPRNKDWVEMVVRLSLDREGGNASVLLDLYVWGDDSYHLEELVHAAQIVILQQTTREPVAFDAAYQAERMATTNYASFSRVLKPIRTATATLAIARWAMDARVKERNRYGFASVVCKMVEDPPFRPNPAIMNTSERTFDAEMITSLVSFEKWFTGARARLERQAEGERVQWNGIAAEFGRRITLLQ